MQEALTGLILCFLRLLQLAAALVAVISQTKTVIAAAPAAVAVTLYRQMRQERAVLETRQALLRHKATMAEMAVTYKNIQLAVAEAHLQQEGQALMQRLEMEEMALPLPFLVRL